MRDTTAFNRMLYLPGASVTGVSFERRESGRAGPTAPATEGVRELRPAGPGDP